MREAVFYTKTHASSVQCTLCPRLCALADGQHGFCRVRKNIGGKLYAVSYGKACSVAIDPIEKVGCTLACSFCQNWEISHAKQVFGQELMPEKLVSMIGKADASGSAGFSWTYTEPTVFYEYFYDTAELAEKQKINAYHVWVSNGYTSAGAVKEAAEYLNAVNIDYKGDDEFYMKLCGARLEHVRNALLAYKKAGVWIEITNLVIPGYNDSDMQIKEMCEWIAGSLGQVPLHFSRFHPEHKLRAEPTPLSTLERAAEIAKQFLDYVYIGNIANPKESTYCHSGFSVRSTSLEKKGKDYHCNSCSAKIPLRGMEWAGLKV